MKGFPILFIKKLSEMMMCLYLHWQGKLKDGKHINPSQEPSWGNQSMIVSFKNMQRGKIGTKAKQKEGISSNLGLHNTITAETLSMQSLPTPLGSMDRTQSNWKWRKRTVSSQ